MQQQSFPKIKREIPRKMKKFRFQVIAKWLSLNYEPCKVADVGGGKGLLSYILNKEGWNSTVIDPVNQALPHKYKTLDKVRVKISQEDTVRRINEKFNPEFVKDFDLVIALHAHGCNMQIIEACAKYNKAFMLIPCCVIDEPIEKDYGINWRNSLIEFANKQGLEIQKVKFNFKGKNIAIYNDVGLTKKLAGIDRQTLRNLVQPDVEPDPDDYYDYLTHINSVNKLLNR